MRRERVVSGTPWEKRFGYARAVRAGGVVAVSGTIASDEAGLAVAHDPYGQARVVFARIEEALKGVGARIDDVVRLRVHYTSPDVAPGFLSALAEAFPNGAPALTTVHVVSLVSSEFLLEVEADAVVEEEREPRPRRDERVPEWDEPVD